MKSYSYSVTDEGGGLILYKDDSPVSSEEMETACMILNNIPNGDALDVIRDLRASLAHLTTELEKARTDRLAALGAQQLAEDVVLSLVPKDKQAALGRAEALRRIYENYDKIAKGS